MSSYTPPGFGWIPDIPDARDYTYTHEAVVPFLTQLKRSTREELPDQVDLRSDDAGEYFTPPADQGPLNCSAVCATISLVEYFKRRVLGETFDGSRLFLYWATRNRMHHGRSMGDTGTDLRTTLKTLVQFGVPPEDYWPFDAKKLNEEPGPFLYGLARPAVNLRYFRLDQRNCDGAATWLAVQSFLAAGFPIVFGYPVPESLTTDPNIPYRGRLDGPRGGQAALAVGYENNHFGRGQHALRVRNSWGSQWGDKGNGWLPISYVRDQLAKDFWTIVSDDWLDSKELSRPHVLDVIDKCS